MTDFAVLSEEVIEKHLNWEEVVSAVRQSLISVTNSSSDDRKHEKLQSVNPKRIFMHLPSNKGLMICMPGYMEGVDFTDVGGRPDRTALSCKILNIIPNAAGINMTTGYIQVFDERTGKLKAILGAERITEWRTSAVTCVGTRLLLGRRLMEKRAKTLAILGAGLQARIHAIAFHNQFNFTEMRFWNRTPERGQKLVDELKSMNWGCNIVFCSTVDDCTKHADVIITATASKSTILDTQHVKNGAIINVVGAGPVSEISPQLYERGTVYVESLDIIKQELPHINAVAELGQLELGLVKVADDPNRINIFLSRGLGTHDAIVSRLIYNKWIKNQN